MVKLDLIGRIAGEYRLRNILAGGVLLFTFLIYNATKAPTVSFWDCGEFIACSHILGIAHPPGSPLYVMIGRIFSMIPFHADIAANVNMLSAVSSAFAAMLAFLIVFKLIEYWWPKKEFRGWRKTAACLGAIVGSMMFAFGRTYWSNAVEAEVYAPAMLLLMIMIWLLLQWVDRRCSSTSDRYLILITYIAFLSIGVHMTAFLFMPAIFLAVIFLSEKLRKDYRFYITGIVLFLISYKLDYFLAAVGIWLLVLLITVLVTRNYLWRLSLCLVLAAVMGFSCQLFIPIRSAQKPSINQNNPSSSFAVFRDFLERKQYSDEDMIHRALTRRSQWKNQFGTYPRIGFWGFFSEQYGMKGRVFPVLFALGLLGLLELIRRKPGLGVPFVIMVLLGTVFLIWYMNFADGTLQNPRTGEGHMEVRDRDYFFTPGFILFGMAIGLGLAGLIELARESLIGKIKPLRTPFMILVSALVLISVAPLKANYFYCDRSQNFVAYDFGYNMLVSCDPKAILFNAGDNDTFPIWCLQEVYCLRPDVAAINLSLATTDWYIKQIRDSKGIPLSWSDAEIEALRNWVTPTGQYSRIQDQVADEILRVTAGRRPLNYSLTIPDDTRRFAGGAGEDRTVMQGLVYRICPAGRPGTIDLQKGHELYWNYFHYRGLSNPAVYKDSHSAGLASNYATGFLLIADSLRRLGQYEGAIMETRRAIEVIPFEPSSYRFLTQLYVESGSDSLVPALIASAPQQMVRGIHYIWGAANAYMGETEKAKHIFKAALDSFPDLREAFEDYCRILYNEKDFGELQQAFRVWLLANPADDDVRQALEEMSRSVPRNSVP